MEVNKVKISLIQLKVINNKEQNLKRAEELINAAVNLYNPQVIVLPECFNTPLGLKYIEEYAEEESSSQSLNLLSNLAKKHEVYIIGGSIIEKENNKFYNTCYCFNKKGEIKAKHRKIHLFDVDIKDKITYKESDKLSPGNTPTVFETEYCKFGISICYDIRFPELAHLLKQEYGVQVLVYPAAFNTVTGPLHWDLLSRTRAVDNNCFVVMCSPARNIDDPTSYQSYGSSQIINPYGKIINTSTYFESIVNTEINLSETDEMTQQIPVWKQKRNDIYKVEKIHK